MAKRLFVLVTSVVACTMPSAVGAQATTRECPAVEEAGPACLLVSKQLPTLPTGKVFWHIDRFPSKAAAEHAGTATGSVVEAFGAVWLFTLAEKRWRPEGGQRAAIVGPLPIPPAPRYAAEYLRSIFAPGTTAPVHVHSGPEAFYAISGDTCLETPDGMRTARGPGNSLMIEAGPPMLLMAIGKVTRHGFALILHDPDKPATTLTHAWHPEGRCARQLSVDQAR